MSEQRPIEQVAGQSSAAERRASVRYLCSLETACKTSAYGKEQRWAATVRDISKEGMGLTVPQKFEPGTVLGVELTNSEVDISYIVSAKVVHSHPQPDGAWRAGCVFIRKLTDEELQSLL